VIDREVPRLESGGSLDLRFRAFADLSDGRRVQSAGDAGSSGICVALVEDSEAAPSLSGAYKKCAREAVEEMAGNTDWLRSEPRDTFQELGLDFDDEELARVSVSAEVDWDSVDRCIKRLGP